MIVGSNILAGASGQAGYFLNRSVRLRSSASAYLNRTPVASNRKLWTWSGWVKRGALSTAAEQQLFMAGVSTDYTVFGFPTSDTFNFQNVNASATTVRRVTTQVFRDPAAWYHIVVVFDTDNATANNRCRIYVNGIEITAFSTLINPSAGVIGQINNNTPHYISQNSTSAIQYLDGYLAEVNFIDGQALTPTSFGEFNTLTGVWQPKKYVGTYGNNGFYAPFTNNANSETLGIDYANTNPELITNGMFVSNVTGWTVAPFGGGSPSITWQSNHTARIANPTNNGTSYYQAITTVIGQTYYAQAYLSAASIGGASRTIALQKADNASFSVNNITVASLTQSAAPSVMRGTFVATATTTYIFINVDILGTGTTGADVSQISVAAGAYKNSWNPFNISTTAGVTYDSMTDVPTLTNPTTANYPVFNPLIKQDTGYTTTISSANLNASITYSSGANMVTIPVTMNTGASGKWYFEVTATSTQPSGGSTGIGISTVASSTVSTNLPLNSYIYVGSDGSKTSYTGTGVNAAYGASYTTNDVIGVALDIDAGTLTFYKNNISQGTAFTGLAATNYFPIVSSNGTGTRSYSINCGQRPFSYTPPTGFLALNTYNLPDSTISNGATQFAATLYTGNGTSQSVVNTVNGKSFQPDLVWIKVRNTAGTNHRLFDSVRGATKTLSSDLTSSEATESGLTSFDSSGFSVGSQVGSNGNTYTIVGWQWKAGGTAVTNTSGSISSQVSANPSAGFSIVTYTGTGANATVGHGLGIAPKMVIVKLRSGSAGTAAWIVYHSSDNASPQSGYMRLDGTGAFASDTTAWNNTAPTSSVFSIGTLAGVNYAAANNYVAYCFSEIAGYSKFGSYTGNGAADGPFVYLGFRPRFILIKSTGVEAWSIRDTSRNTYNVVDKYLLANASDAEGTFSTGDILSNGFKIRNTGTGSNTNGQTYIYAAFAENPFKNALAR